MDLKNWGKKISERREGGGEHEECDEDYRESEE